MLSMVQGGYFRDGLKENEMDNAGIHGVFHSLGIR